MLKCITVIALSLSGTAVEARRGVNDQGRCVPGCRLADTEPCPPCPPSLTEEVLHNPGSIFAALMGTRGFSLSMPRLTDLDGYRAEVEAYGAEIDAYASEHPQFRESERFRNVQDFLSRSREWGVTADAYISWRRSR